MAPQKKAVIMANENDDVEKTDEELDQEFESAWKDSTENESDADNSSGGDSDDDADDGDDDAKAEQDAGESTDDKTDDDDKDERTAEELKAELEEVSQKLRSAEGRLQSSGKLEDQVKELKIRQDEIQGELETVISDGKAAASKGSDQDASASSGDEIIPEGYTPEEWASFAEDFPQQAKAAVIQEQRIRKAQSTAESATEQAASAVDIAALEQFNKPILAKHEDYFEICEKPDELEAFIAEQSPALKRAYLDIIKSGSQDEVIDLLDQFKSSKKTDDSDSDGKSDDESDKQNLSDEKKRKAKKAMAVKKQQSSSPNVNKGDPDMDDFDSAWAERNRKK